jgi:hypothetical protein
MKGRFGQQALRKRERRHGRRSLHKKSQHLEALFRNSGKTSLFSIPIREKIKSGSSFLE